MEHAPMNADIDMIEALLAHMQQNPNQMVPYDDLCDDDDEDYDDEEEDDDDEYYGGGGGGEHSIQTLLNPYNNEGDMGGGSHIGHSMQDTMSLTLLQGLLTSSMAEVGNMGAMAGMAAPMEGGGNFLQSLIPKMDYFAGGVNTIMEEYNKVGGKLDYNKSEYVLSDEDDDDDDDDDDIEEEDDYEEDDEDDKDLNPIMLAGAGAAGLMAASMMPQHQGQMNAYNPDLYRQNQGQRPPQMHHQRGLPSTSPPSSFLPQGPSPMPLVPVIAPIVMSQAPNFNPPALTAPAPPLPAPLTVPQPIRQHPAPPTPSVAPAAAPAPNPMMAAVSTTATVASSSMSGGTVSRVDLFAALSITGAAETGGIVSSALSNSGGKTIVKNKLDTSDTSTGTLVGNDSLNLSSKTIQSDTDEQLAQLMYRTYLSSLPEGSKQKEISLEKHLENQTLIEGKNLPYSQAKPTRVIKDDSDDEKASVPGSETSGGGKSDTESIRKKTPSPTLATKMGRLSPTSSESTHGQELASCASITDLASATESMRDSDTDNHSDAHNVTANFSDLDNEIIDQHKNAMMSSHYAMPFIEETPKNGWECLVGMETPKEQLKKLFYMGDFPEVFEGTRGMVRGVLLFGPVGSGKTTLSRALAKECNNSALIAVSCNYLLNQPPMNAINVVRYAFEQARARKPTVLLFDDIESLNVQSRMEETKFRARAELLAQVRGFSTLVQYQYNSQEAASMANDNIMLVGTTHQPWLLDDEIRRLFTYNIHIKLPSEKDREELFRQFLSQVPNNVQAHEYKCLVSKSEGYSATDVNMIIRQSISVINNDRANYPNSINRPNVVTFDDLATIMTNYRCRHSEDIQKKYSRYIDEATHRTEDADTQSEKDKVEKPKGVRKFGQRIFKKFVAAAVTVID